MINRAISTGDPTDSPPVFRIDPAALYSPEALEHQLRGIMCLNTFLNRVQPKKRFKGAYWGADLIEAIGEVPVLGDGASQIASIVPKAVSRSKPSSRMKSRPPGLIPIRRDEV